LLIGAPLAEDVNGITAHIFKELDC